MQDPSAASREHPFEGMADGAEWFEALELDDTTRARIPRESAIALLNLSPPGT